jgi:hypothetical protein
MWWGGDAGGDLSSFKINRFTFGVENNVVSFVDIYG